MITTEKANSANPPAEIIRFFTIASEETADEQLKKFEELKATTLYFIAKTMDRSLDMVQRFTVEKETILSDAAAMMDHVMKRCGSRTILTESTGILLNSKDPLTIFRLMMTVVNLY
ncbi:hypothetical protein RCL1_000151 [Eukaryota sp. TZLM3-RCL]